MTTIKINFTGGIISPGNLHDILVAAAKANVYQVKFGLRQQLLIETEEPEILGNELELLKINYETVSDEFPNIVSSYPAEEIFITNTWLSEGVYKDIFDQIDHRPRLKINVSDSNQSFTPLLTGNINWVASPRIQHFWHLFIRFPKTNTIYEWKDLVYTNDVARMSKHIETLIPQLKTNPKENPKAAGDLLYELVLKEKYITESLSVPLIFPNFNLPYYEGLNRYYYDKSWLGIYRRDEMFSLAFLKDLCSLCLQTKIGEICASPWKSLIIKGIEEKDRQGWSNLLSKYQINVRHAANELNFQVEDNSEEGLKLKKFLVRHLSNADIRTFGVCIGIKTRTKSEVFSNILIKRKPLLRLGQYSFFHLYDILCANNFNPNERTAYKFSKNNLKIWLPEQLRRAILAYNNHQLEQQNIVVKKKASEPQNTKKKEEYVHQCQSCFTVYDETLGEPDIAIAKGTHFDLLPSDFCCLLCESPKDQFVRIKKSKLGLIDA